MKKIVLIAIAAVVIVGAVGVGAAVALRGDDAEAARGDCGTATYELEAESDDEGLEVTFELQSAGPGETWQVDIEQDGTPLWTGERATDDEGELDVDVLADEDGGDELTAVAEPADGSGEACTVSVTR